MKRRLTTVCFAILFFASSIICTNYAQTKYGKTTMEEMEMSTYENDPSASALILLKEGYTEFKYNEELGFHHETSYQMKIKILKEDGLKHCEASISYYRGQQVGSREDIKGLSGSTYNLENGKIVRTKLSKEFIVEEELDEVYRRMKFTMPAAKVGSVIEYKYTIVSPFNYSLRSFDFQAYIPVQYVRYEINIPEYFTYNQSGQGYEAMNTPKIEDVNLRFDMRISDGHRTFMHTDQCVGKRYIYSGENLPAMKEEPYVWSTKDYINRVSFELRDFRFKYGTVKQFSNSWTQIDKTLLDSKYFGGNLKRTGLFKNDDLPSSKDLSAATAIVATIRERVRWNGKSTFSPENLAKALKDGTGNSSDMNFLAINALKAAGIDAFPIILSTRANGRIPLTHPSAAAFNFCITGVEIDEKLYTIDVSDKYSIWNVIPNKAMVTQARIMKEGFDKWIDLSTASKGIEYIMSMYKFNDNGEYEGNITSSYRQKDAYEFRNYLYGKHKDEQNYQEELAKRIGLSIENFKIENGTDLGKDVVRKFSIKPDIRLGDEFVYIDPMIIKQFDENPFKAETRKFPIQFDYIENHLQTINIAIPKGYVVDELPQSATFLLDEENSIRFSYIAASDDQFINIKYQFNLNNLLVLPDKYPNIQDFFTKVISKCSEMVILKRKADTAENVALN